MVPPPISLQSTNKREAKETSALLSERFPPGEMPKVRFRLDRKNSEVTAVPQRTNAPTTGGNPSILLNGWAKR